MADVSIQQIGPLNVAFKFVRGPFEQIPQAFGELYPWLEHYGLHPAGMPQVLYITDPKVTPLEENEWEVWAPIAGGAGLTGPDEHGFGVKRIEPETMATSVFTGSWDAIAPFYDEVLAWLEANGYRPSGPIREVYYDGPEVPPDQNRTEIQIPVTRTAT